MKLDIPIDVEVHAEATSRYTLETIERRLADLRGRDDEETAREIEYLTCLKQTTESP